jgi:cell fate regulator YaaT (PSP1 superfamily)
VAFIIRYGRMQVLGTFDISGRVEAPPRLGSRCIVRTERGTELGTVLAEAPAEAGPATGILLRAAEPRDIEQGEALAAQVEAQDLPACADSIAKLGLPMRLVGAERLLEDERIIFYFTAEQRVDFRKLVRVLARRFKTRIELRQVGARDRARLIGGFGVCGQPLCCRQCLRSLDPVTMRMAKVQGRSLSPESTCGVCARLKCCLRYEDETYRELRSLLPRQQDIVEVDLGNGAPVKGEVIDIDLFHGRVIVEMQGGERSTVGREAILSSRRPSPLPQDGEGGEGAEGTSRRRRRKRR